MSEKLFYLYHHIRLDTNQVFYVGIGKIYYRTKNKVFKSEKEKFSRAYYINNRSDFWKNIVAKTNYRVEIIFLSDSKEEIKQKEIEHISFYGRKDLSKGTLVNLTDGGDGAFNVSKSTRLKMRKAKLGKKVWNKGKKGAQEAWNKGISYNNGTSHIAREALKKKCYLINVLTNDIIEFDQLKDLAKHIGLTTCQHYLDTGRLFKNAFWITIHCPYPNCPYPQ